MVFWLTLLIIACAIACSITGRLRAGAVRELSRQGLARDVISPSGALGRGANLGFAIVLPLCAARWFGSPELLQSLGLERIVDSKVCAPIVFSYVATANLLDYLRLKQIASQVKPRRHSSDLLSHGSETSR